MTTAKKFARKPNVVNALLPSESQIQAAICQYLDKQHPDVIYAHIPNGQVLSGVIRGLLGAEKAAVVIGRIMQGMLRIGVKKGMPDLILHWNYGHTAYVEVKRHDGRVSPEQKALHRALILIGHQVHIVRSVDEFHALAAQLKLPKRGMA